MIPGRDLELSQRGHSLPRVLQPVWATTSPGALQNTCDSRESQGPPGKRKNQLLGKQELTPTGSDPQVRLGCPVECNHSGGVRA